MRVYRTPNNDEKKKMRSSGRRKIIATKFNPFFIRFRFGSTTKEREMNELK
jgi:hypothetical protein